jgi:lipopolysaccharide assembly outer membrane protein LptD (OstA)
MRAGILSVLTTWIVVSGPINGQNNELNHRETRTVPDSLAIPSDALSQPEDSTRAAKENTSSPFIDSEVKHNARDSTIFDHKKIYLYGDASVSYRDILLTANFIELNLDSNLAYASGTRDSLGVEQGLPVFKDKSGEYTMRRLKYNFETGKAIIEHVVTEQGEGYIIGEKAKKNNDNTYFLKDGRYTTCSNHDHPHFYINMTKAKVIPGDKVIMGPAYLVVEDVKIYPLFVPFAFVPITSGYHSGFLMPSYGEDSDKGFFLKDGGYYFAFNDYFDLALTGDIYGNGSWAISASSSYKKRYKYSGSFNFEHITTLSSEEDLPDYSESKDMSLTWSHRQDAKANPNQSFSASVNYSTSSYDVNNVGSIIDAETLATNQKQSSISYSRSFPNKPFNFSSTLSHSQNSSDSTISLTLPNVTFTMSRIYPFKQKNGIGEDKWYESIGFSYSAYMSNSISSVDEDELSFTAKSLNEDWKNGIKHSIPVSMTFKLFNNFSLTPSISYTERWYSKSITKEWDDDESEIVSKDTTSGFYRVYDYSFSVGTSTKLYTFFTPSRAIFGDKINTIRHVMTPSVSLSYRPDFSDPKYGFYDWIEYYNSTLNSVVKYEYSYFADALYGTAGSGQSGSMSLGLGNTLEMKVKSDKDSTGFKTVSILESLSLSTSYNFLADSMNLSNISMSGRTKIFGTSISFGATFDPYALDTISTTTGTVSEYRSRHYEITKTGRLARLKSANLSFGLSFDSKTFKKDNKETDTSAPGSGSDSAPNDQTSQNNTPNGSSQENSMPENETVPSINKNGYTKFEVPWNASLSYSMRLSQDDFNEKKMDYDYDVTADVNFSGHISLTPKWDLSMSSGYDIIEKEIAQTSLQISRDLHCWSMSFSLVPIGTYKSYFFSKSVNSSLLSDLKYEKRSSERDSPGWD